MNVKVTLKIVFIVLIGLLILSAFLIPKWRQLNAYSDQIPFEQAIWSIGPEPNGHLSPRQKMVSDLVSNVLPGKSRTEVEHILGTSPTHEELRRRTQADLSVTELNDKGEWKPYPKSGEGHYWDEFDWDMIYFIGYEYTPFWSNPSPRRETLILRFDDNGIFSTWYLDGSDIWAQIVGESAAGLFKRTRH